MPIAFLMYPVKDLRSLKKQTIRRRISWDKPLIIKLSQSGKEAELSISGAKGEAQVDRRFDWEFTVKLTGGKLLETKPEILSLAPLKGYKKSLEYKSNDNGDKWGSVAYVHLFYHLSDDTFGRIDLMVAASGRVTVTDYYDPSGGRLLEMGDTK